MSFSQEGEDLLIERIFPEKRNGFYVDVGAHHPTRFSNTYLLYRRGWRGINIDAMPGSMEAFRRRRPRDINVECGVGPTGRRTLHLFDEPALNTMDPDLKTDREATGRYSVVGAVDIEVRPLSDLLDEFLPGNVEHIDVMSIDVEGADLDVLRSNDWDRWRPRLLVVEILKARPAEFGHSPTVAYLTAMGYVLLSRLFNSAIFIDRDADIGTGVGAL